MRRLVAEPQKIEFVQLRAEELPAGLGIFDVASFAQSFHWMDRMRVADRSEDAVVASVYSLTSSAPHLFGERLGEFEAELRSLLRRTAPEGRFSERTRKIELVIWPR